MSAIAFDALPALVAAWVRGESDGSVLLREVMRHVARVAGPYPDAWFALGRKHPEAIDDLAHRVYTTCARVVKGRFPFSGRTPFRAYVDEDFDGRAIRYHSFYARLSITRELLRADYAHNLASDPRLVWRADLYGEIGDVLRARATKLPGAPPRWQLAGPAAVREEHVLVERLRAEPGRDVPTLVERALRLGGPRTQSQLCRAIEAVIGTPSGPEAEPEPPPDDVASRAAVRAAVLEGWAALDPEDRALLRAIARGESYDEVCAALPAFAHKVAVHRALERIGRRFVARLTERVGAPAAAEVPPRVLLERVLDVLAELGEPA
jgi:hypothetical protein